MSTFGCHTCGVDLSKYESYEYSPCATCKLRVEYNSTKRAALFDSAIDIDDDEQLAKCDVAVEDTAIGSDDNKYAREERRLNKQLKGIESLKKAIESQVFSTAAGLILRFVKLAKENPIMFEIVIKKMQFPHMSYSELGNSVTPACSKQNVLYHLKHAVRLFPEIGSALITDTRFTAGKYALRTVADAHRKQTATQNLQKILYGDDVGLKAMTMKEIRSIIAAPFMTTDDVLNFNPYIEDEEDDYDPAKEYNPANKD